MMKMELGLCCQMDSQLNPNSTPYWQTQCTTSQSLDSLSIHLSRWYKIDWNHCVTHQCLECSRGLMNGQVTNQHADLLYFVGKTIHTAILDQEWGALGSGPSTNQHWDPDFFLFVGNKLLLGRGRVICYCSAKSGNALDYQIFWWIELQYRDRHLLRN